MLKDLRQAARILSKNPGFAIVAICSLAIGIGATSAMFSFADALLLRPLPIAQPSRVAAISTRSTAAFGANTAISYPDYKDYRDRNRTFSGIEASSYTTFGFSPDQATLPRMRFGLYVSGNFFSVLGVDPVLGRGFRPDEDQAEGRNPVVVLGHDFWVSQFHASPAVLGSKLRLNGIDFTIIGVAPERFTGIDQALRPTMFVPFSMSPRLGRENNLSKRDVRWLVLKGRLKPDVSLSQAQSDLNAIAVRLQQTYPQTNRNQNITVQSEFQLVVAQSPPNVALLTMLCLLALCVLLVACANVAGLLLSRARARSREVAIRLAIGANRGALLRQLFTENLLLAFLGGFAGVGIAYAGTRFLSSFPIPTDLPIVLTIAVDHRVLLFTLFVSIFSTLLFGLTPALRATRPDLVTALKATDADSAGRRRLWGRNLIVAGQLALSLLLLIISAVLFRGFNDELRQGPGFRTDHLFLTTFDTQLIKYNETQTRQFFKDILDRARATPEIKSAALTSVVPMLGAAGLGIVPEGYHLPNDQQYLTIFNAYVSDGFFKTLDVRLLSGRPFLESDKADSPLVAIVDEHLAKHYWPNGALGKRFHLRTTAGPLVEIVGITKTSKHFWIAEPPLDFAYLPYTQHSQSQMTLAVESRTDDAALLAPAVRQLIRNLDPNIPTYDIRTMSDIYTQRAVKTPNLITQTVAGLGMMGLILAVVGLYGLISYSVSQRTREIGIRMAIGADRNRVVQMVLKQGFTLGLIGIAFGLVLGILATRLVAAAVWVASFTNTPPLLFIAIALPLLLVAVLATYLPARRASLIDPMRALRDE